MKRWLIFALLCSPAWAATTYVSQSGGVFSGGTACNGQVAVSAATYNVSGGNPVVLCGTITTALRPPASGNSGTPITITFDTGAQLATGVFPVSGALNLSSRSWIIIDGGAACGANVTNKSLCNGIIQNTANGTGLANHTDQTVGINVDGSSNITIQNLMVGPIYVHTSVSDTNVPGQPLPSAVWGNSATNLLIQNSTFHDANWNQSFVSGTASSGLTWTNDDIYNSDHCWAVGVVSQTTTNIQINGNHCHDGANWDTTANFYHHDGVHLYTTTGTGKVTNARTYNNIFDGNWGVNNTAAIFEEGPGGGEVDNLIYNNFFGQSGFVFNWNNGFINLGNLAGTNSSVTKIYNNTAVAGTGMHSYFWQLAYSIDMRNNVLITSDTASGIVINLLSNVTGTVDYNTYAAPGSSPFQLNGVAKSFAQWQAAGWDAHAPAGTPGHAPFNINATTGVPSSSFIGIGTGINLSSLGIPPLNNDQAGNPRPTAWTIGALNLPGSTGKINGVTLQGVTFQ